MADDLILIVEDESDAAQLLEFHLHRRGYRSIVARDGQTALNLAFANRPDLILLDLMLPNLSGFEVCRLLKAAPLTADIPVLMLTAMGSIDDKVKGFRHGADDFLTKPYEMAELLVRVQALLRRSEVAQFTHL
jgi:DNA-binding response OmpR family regulator